MSLQPNLLVSISERWTQKLSSEAEIEITESDDNSYIAMVGELGVLMRLYDDLCGSSCRWGRVCWAKVCSTTAHFAWLELSTEIDYAYLTLEEKQPSVAYELNVSGSSQLLKLLCRFERCFQGIDLVIGRHNKPRRKPVVRKNNDSVVYGMFSRVTALKLAFARSLEC